MTVRSASQATIFVSYARQDKDLVEEFKKQLSSLEIPLWYNQDIVSPNFMASDYCLNIEAKRALEGHKAGTPQVIPVLLHLGDWYAMPFADLEYLPRRSKPAEAWPDRDEAFRDVASDLRIEVQKCQLEAASIPNVKELQQVQEERRKQL